MSQNTDDMELWIRLARGQYPTYPDSLLQDIRVEHAMEWCIDAKNEKAELYDKFVMLKQLMKD